MTLIMFERRHRVIIVEGVDNSGKSTLAKTLSEHFDWPLVHSPGFCPEMIDWAKTHLTAPGTRIYDRFPCVSEHIYGPVLRDKDEFKSVVGRKVLSFFIQKNPLIIYCKPPDSVITEDMGKQMKGVKDNILRLILNYNRMMVYFSLWHLLIIKYDFTERSEIGWENLINVISYREGKFSGKHKRF